MNKNASTIATVLLVFSLGGSAASIADVRPSAGAGWIGVNTIAYNPVAVRPVAAQDLSALTGAGTSTGASVTGVNAPSEKNSKRLVMLGLFLGLAMAMRRWKNAS